MRNPYKTSVGKPEDKRTPLEPSWRMKDNIKMYIVHRKILSCVAYSMPSVQQRVVFE